MVNMSLAYFPPVQFTTIIIIIISRTLTEVDLPVASSPHRVAVVDADVLPLLDVHRRPDHHPEVSVEMFACIVDAGVLEEGDVRVQCLRWSWGNWQFMGIDIEHPADVQDFLCSENGFRDFEELSGYSHHRCKVLVIPAILSPSLLVRLQLLQLFPFGPRCLF